MDFRLSLDNVSDKLCVMAVVVSGALVKLIGLAAVSRNQRRFELVGKVSDLVAFPMKSCKGIHCTDAICTDVGLEKDGLIDRHWMLIGEDEKHFNMRLGPRLTLVESHSMGDILRLTAPGMEPLDLPKYPDLKTAKIIDKMAYGQHIRVVDCGERAHEWFRRFLGGAKVQLVNCRKELCTRDISERPRDWENDARRGDKTIFSFMTSYMLTTTSSLKDLNSRLTNPITMDNFRPNIVVDNDGTPFDEDRWEEIKIGDNLVFHSVEPCLRCIITTIDPDTAQKDKDMQPLKTLRSYRLFPKYKPGPIFGVYISNDTTGRIQIGDPVYAKRKPST